MALIGNLDILLSASTSGLSKGFKKAQGMTTAFNAKVSKAIAGPGGVGGAIAGAIGGISVAAGIKYAVGQFQQIEEAQSKLRNAFKATDGAAGQSVGGIVSYARELSQTTRFSASATTDAAAALAKFQMIKGDTFTGALKQAQNLSTVMGKDLTSSANELGHALQNPKLGYLELAKTGVMFSEAQIDAIQSMQEAGDIAGAQGVILDALKTQYDGAAEAAGETLSGKLDILHNTFSNVASVVGEAVAPAIKGAIDLMTGWLGSLDQNSVKSKSWEWMAKSIAFVSNGLQFMGIAWKAAQVAADLMLFGAIKAAALLAKGIEASVNWLRKLAGLKEISLGAKSLDDFAAGAMEVANKDAKSLTKAWLAPDASKAVDSFFANAAAKNEAAMAAIGRGAEKAGDAIKNGPGEAMKQLSEKAIGAQEEAVKLVEDLQRSIKFFGMDEKQKKVAELQDKGATKGQVAQLKQLSATLRGKEIAMDVERPIDKFKREMKKLAEVRELGGIDSETHDRAKQKLVHELQNSLPQNKASAGGALSRNSAEARSALLNYQNAKANADPMVALQRIEEQALNEQKQGNVWLRELVKAQPAIAGFAGL